MNMGEDRTKKLPNESAREADKDLWAEARRPSLLAKGEGKCEPQALWEELGTGGWR
jgi:hypothetical protein